MTSALPHTVVDVQLHFFLKQQKRKACSLGVTNASPGIAFPPGGTAPLFDRKRTFVLTFSFMTLMGH